MATPALTPEIIELLTVLQGYTELALMMLEEELEPDDPVLRYLRLVHAACLRVHQLVLPYVFPETNSGP